MNQPAPPQAKRHLGQILIDQGILTEDQLRIALLEQTKQHIPVGKLLVQLGFVSEATLRDALSEKLGLQSVDLSRIIAGKLRIEIHPVDLPSIIDMAIDAVRPAADAKGITLDRQLGTLPERFAGDANRLQQVIWNLLSNAVKFTNESGRVEDRKSVV